MRMQILKTQIVTEYLEQKGLSNTLPSLIRRAKPTKLPHMKPFHNP